VNKYHYLWWVLLSASLITAAPVDDRRGKALDNFIRGTVAEQAEEYHHAIVAYQEALGFDSTSAFIHTALAQSYLAIGSVEKAEQTLKRALALDPMHVPALELLALILQRTDQVAAARPLVERLVAAEPRNPAHARELLSVLMTVRDYDGADRLFATLDVDAEDQSLLNRQMVAVYLNAKEFKRSLPYLARLRTLDSTDASVYFSSGTTYLQLLDTVRALDYMERATSLDSKEPRFWNGRVVVALNKRDYAGALACADSGLTNGGPDAGLYNVRGVALQRLRRLPEALESLHSALRTDTTFYTPLGTLALIYDELDSLVQAEYFYRQAILHSDGAAVFLNNLAYTFAVRGINLVEAKELAEQALAKEPDNPSYKDTIGWVEFRLGDHDAALRWLKAAAKESPDSPEVLEHLGDVYYAKGSLSKANEYYRKALTIDPENTSVREKITP
jgi:tetratricopeptide (TPR) repeat protein